MLKQVQGKRVAHPGEGPAYLLLEIGQGQGEMVSSLVNDYFPQASIELVSDLGGVERVMKVGLQAGKSVLKE
jgi:methylase of polypeptide subunit release factors